MPQPTERIGAAITGYNNMLYLFGGERAGNKIPNSFLNDVYTFNITKFFKLLILY